MQEAAGCMASTMDVRKMRKTAGGKSRKHKQRRKRWRKWCIGGSGASEEVVHRRKWCIGGSGASEEVIKEGGRGASDEVMK
jgi:hypothetical protein